MIVTNAHLSVAVHDQGHYLYAKSASTLPSLPLESTSILHTVESPRFHFLSLPFFLDFSQDNFSDQEIEVRKWVFTDSAHP